MIVQRFFVDHDARYFGVILNYMRDGKIRSSELQNVDKQELLDEFNHFSVPAPYFLTKYVALLVNAIILLMLDLMVDNYGGSIL